MTQRSTKNFEKLSISGKKIKMKEIEQLIEISQFYGRDSRYVIAGGGNTSYKNAICITP
mgnify:CR=1 FL=1